jgi:alpha-2-macroglobulin-like protein
MNRRDGKGGFLLGSQYWQAAGSVRNAYIVWGLVETGEVNLQRELTRVVRGALDGQNAYVMALALLSDAKLHPQSDRCKSLGKKLLGTKQADGQFRGLEEWATVFGSRGRAAAVETTALALLALKRAGFGLHPDSIEWLRAQRHGSGYGGTQATVLALKALTNAQFAGGRLEFQVGYRPPRLPWLKMIPGRLTI